MRPRIKKGFGKITHSELKEYLTNNRVYGFTVDITENTLIYSYNIMFRKNKENPEMLFVEVSQSSKLVLKAWTDKGKTFNNIKELLDYTILKI